MDEVNEIKLRDLQLMGSKYNLNSGVGTLEMGRVQDDTFTGWGTLTYLGKTSNGVNYEYTYRTGWQFDRIPFFTLTDTVGHSWQTHTTSISTTATYDRYSNGYFGHSNRITIDNSNVAGSKAKIDLVGDPGRHYGYLTDKVRIPIAGNTGTQGQFASAYGHSHLPYSVGINIGGYGNISFSGGAGDKWTWKNNFIIGDTK